MSGDAFPLDAYLERIDYSGSVAATEETLEAIQRAQLARIPFENFDVLLRRDISLDPNVLFKKLIASPRGGYCFELNGLLLMALQRVGFEARALLARVHTRGQPTGRTHELILVTLGGRFWIADAGFGGPCLRAPIPLELDVLKPQESETFRLVDAGQYGTMLQMQSDARWLDLYSFDLGHVFEADIAVGNHFTSTSPFSSFTQSGVAALHTSMGKTTLYDRTLKRVDDGAEDELELGEGAAYRDALKLYFGIEIDAPADALFGSRTSR